ncbi:MAG: hybrid sensor histidine kinase/response regulator [Bacteroidales bacterium]|nr:hybrid sensor histidine kinase/response regulator [Bacteroidales bacterium]
MTQIYKSQDINILIVDDNIENIQIIGQILMGQNYNLSFATSGSEALHMLMEAEQKYDLLLLDVLMPGQDGFSVCRKIRSNPALSQLPIIFLTAKADSKSVLTGLELGANDYIFTPFNNRELLLRVKTQIDLKKQREALETFNQSLEEIIAQRTEQLGLALSKLEILEQAKSNFLRLISHELRTPLNIISGFTEILQESLQNTAHVGDLAELKTSTDQLISLAETALLITEIQLGKYAPDFSLIDLKAICKENARRYQKSFKGVYLQFHFNYAQNDSKVYGDHNLIDNIVGKVTENAINACGDRCEITFQLTREGENTVLEINDDGTGFDAKDMEQIFEKFSKEGPDLNYDGFGLGLSTVKLVMDLHRGKVSVRNHEQGGASVRLEFPKSYSSPAGTP